MQAANNRIDVASSSQPISDRAAIRDRYPVMKGVDAYRGLLMAGRRHRHLTTRFVTEMRAYLAGYGPIAIKPETFDQRETS